VDLSGRFRAKVEALKNKKLLYMFESIRLGSMDFELKFKDAIEQMSTRK
jgi:hypothetical protein